MITLKSKREIEHMQESGAILANIHTLLRDFVKPGVKTIDINHFVQKHIEKLAQLPLKSVSKVMNMPLVLVLMMKYVMDFLQIIFFKMGMSSKSTSVLI